MGTKEPDARSKGQHQWEQGGRWTCTGLPWGIVLELTGRGHPSEADASTVAAGSVSFVSGRESLVSVGKVRQPGSVGGSDIRERGDVCGISGAKNGEPGVANKGRFDTRSPVSDGGRVEELVIRNNFENISKLDG